MLATIMQAIDTTIANVALPYMQGTLSATMDQANWVLTSYIVAAAIMTPPTGWLAGAVRPQAAVPVPGDRLHDGLGAVRRCAQSLGQIVLFRLLQGMCGAALVPLSQAVLLDTWPREKHGSAMALWGVGVMVGPILGPTLGGWLTESYSWRWVFYVNVPVGILAVLGLLTFLSETKRQQVPFDWFGFITLSLAIGALQLMLDRGEQLNWFGSAEIIAEATVSAIAFYLFLVHTFTAERPFVEPAAVPRPQFLGRAGVHLRGRRHPAGDPGAADAVSAEPDGLSGADRGHGAGAARHGHHADDVPGRPAGRQDRQPAADRRRPRC